MSALSYCRVLLVSFVVGGVALSAQSKVELDKLVKIKEWGYQIQPIKGWNSMPADQDDRFNAGRWKLSVDQFEKRGDWDAWQSGQFCELSIVRIQPKNETPAGASTPEGKPEKKEKPIGLPSSWEKRLNPKTLDDWIEANFEGASKRWKREPLKGSKMPGDLLEFGSGAQHITIGQFRHLGVEWAVVYTAFEENYRKTWRDTYIKSICSFQVTDNVDPSIAAATKKDPSKLEGEEKRVALKASIAGNPGWYAHDTKYYVFLSNTDKAFIKQLADSLEAVREKVYVPNFKPRNDKIPLNPVRVFDKESEYYQYGGPGGSAGYFSPTKGELVLFAKFQGASKSDSRDDCRSVMFHEGFHQYIHFAVGDVSPHSWFNEGHGDYFAGIGVAGGSIKFNLFDWRVRYLKDHLNDKKDLIPTRTLVRLPQSEYYSNAGLKYSQGWALIYYLRSVSRNKQHKQVLDAYFTYLADNVAAFRERKKEGEDGDTPRGGESVPGIPGLRIFNFADQEKVEQILSEAVDKAFAGVDLEALDKDLRAWLEKL